MINTLYLRALLRSSAYFAGRALFRNRMPIDRVARHTELLSQGRSFHARRPFVFEEHLARIQSTRHYTPRQIVENHIRRKTIDFRPLRLHWVDGAWIIDNSVFLTGAQRIEIGNTLAPRSVLRRLVPEPVSPMANIDEGVLVGSCAGTNWFGHWLEDEVPMQLLGSAYGTPVASRRPVYAHEPGYLSALALPQPSIYGVCRIERLVVVDEFAQNPNKTRRYAEMRCRLKSNRDGGKRVFLLRGDSGTQRRLVNERDLASRLESEGFTILDIGRASFQEVVDTCGGAEVVAGVEGSHLAHALFLMRDYGTLLILNPPNQVHTTVADIGVFCRLVSGMFVCTEAGVGGEFFADIDEVLGFLDGLLRHSKAERSALGAYVDEVIAMADAESAA